MPQVLDWWRIAQQCFSDDYGSLERGFLTSIFMLICGIERVFHLDEMDEEVFDSQRLCHHAQQIHAMREAVLRL